MIALICVVAVDAAILVLWYLLAIVSRDGGSIGAAMTILSLLPAVAAMAWLDFWIIKRFSRP